MDNFTPLVHYPTTTVFIDDNRAFLESFSLLFAEDFTFRLFDSAREALSVINNSQVSLGKQLVRNSTNFREADSAEPVLFTREITNSKKYSEISVIVVDHAMPEMSGLDFCQKIDNPLIKKVLFTGQADESIARRAIDQGVIDACILKSVSKVSEAIISTVSRLKNDYFASLSASLQMVSSEDNKDFVFDPDFQSLLNSLLESGPYVEYYYQTNPPGYLLFTRTGVCNRLVVYTQEFIDQFVTEHKETLSGAVAKAIAAGEVIPYFPPRQSLAYGHADFRWQSHLYPAKSFRGNTLYRYALIDNPQLQLLNNQAPSTYEAYLEELDQQLFAH